MSCSIQPSARFPPAERRAPLRFAERRRADAPSPPAIRRPRRQVRRSHVRRRRASARPAAFPPTAGCANAATDRVRRRGQESRAQRRPRAPADEKTPPLRWSAGEQRVHRRNEPDHAYMVGERRSGADRLPVDPASRWITLPSSSGRSIPVPEPLGAGAAPTSGLSLAAEADKTSDSKDAKKIN